MHLKHSACFNLNKVLQCVQKKNEYLTTKALWQERTRSIYTINGYYWRLSELFITFLLDLSVLHFQITISLLPHPTHWWAVMEPLIHRATFASRLHSDFKHPDLHASALCAIPPRTNLISYSHASCLLNSAKLFWICHQEQHVIHLFCKRNCME